MRSDSERDVLFQRVDGVVGRTCRAEGLGVRAEVYLWRGSPGIRGTKFSPGRSSGSCCGGACAPC